MSATSFNSLDYYNQLKETGISEKQAQVQAKALSNLVENLATKQDIHKLENKLENKIQKMETHFEGRLKELEERVTHKLTIRCGSMMAASVTVLAVIIKLV